jgi:hypothetical protein
MRSICIEVTRKGEIRISLEFITTKKLKKQVSEILQNYYQKIREIIHLERERKKKSRMLLDTILNQSYKLFTISNILRILVGYVNYKLIMNELGKQHLTFIKLNMFGTRNEIPLLLIYLLAALANSGILESLLKVWKEKKEKSMEYRRN